ncbi:hypothetical protein GF373_17405, partial [bacterium]|nr:hypothetical protein [bacterium]
MQNKIRILCWADSPTVQTGFGTVSKYILKKLQNTGNYEIDVLGINYHGDFYDREEFPYQLTAAKLLDPRDPYGNEMFKRALIKKQYDVVWVLNDTFVVHKSGLVVQEIKKNYLQRGLVPPLFVYYFPVDCSVFKEYSGMLEAADVVVAYTDFGVAEVLKTLPNIKPKLRQIYHGVNTESFKPLSVDERLHWRRTYLHAKDDEFIIVNVNRNSPRKQLTHTIRVFSEFKKKVPNSKLYLHTNAQDNGISLLIACRELGLSTSTDVIFPKNYSPSAGFPEEVLNRLYNCGDAFLSTHLGEGFGLCVHPDTLIDTLGKFVRMEEVKTGDCVLTEDGTYREVVDKISRKDKVLEVNVFGTPNTLVTPQHPFLAVKMDGRSRRSAVWECCFDHPNWVPSFDLKKGDFVAIVKPKDRYVI